MRRTFQILFAIVIIAAILFSIYCGIISEWNTLTASLALAIAVISAWLAYESFHRIMEAEKAYITFDLDFASRQGVCLFVLKNIGKHPAYNVSLKWDNDLINHTGAIVSLGLNPSSIISVFNGGETVEIVVNSTEKIFSENSPVAMEYSGLIHYSERADGKNHKSTRIEFSFDLYRNSVMAGDDQAVTMYELRQVPDRLKAIEREINNINKNT